MTTFPKHGTPLAELEAEMDALTADDPDLSLGGLLGPEHVRDVAQRAYNRFFEANALLGPRIPSTWKMQNDLQEMSVDLLNGGPDARASITTGGSESIFCALHAMREWARDTKPEITHPEVVVPYSAHAAFSKGCHFLGLTLVRVPLGDDYRADVTALEAAITENTVGLVGSAPCWPYGLYDPIPQIAALAQSRGLWMHVDACVGGFFAPFARKLGYALPDWDLAVPGVCSISADLHKYGFSPKPCSVVLYSSATYHAYQPHVVDDWPTGPYRTETVVGSRAAGAVAGAWAVLRYQGEEGFLASTARIMQTKERLVAGINEIPGLKAWDNDLCLLAFGAATDLFDTQTIAGGLRERGWFVFGTLEPPLINMAISAVDDDTIVERFLTDLEAIVHAIDEQTRTEGELSYAQ